MLAGLGGVRSVLRRVYARGCFPAREREGGRLSRFCIGDHASSAADLLEEGRAATMAMGWRLIVMNQPEKRPNKAPEPTPGLVTSRAEMASEMISSGKARLAPSPVVAHL